MDIELKITAEKCLQYARTAIQKEEWNKALLNLNEGLSMAESEEMRERIYLAYADLFLLSGNLESGVYALYRAQKEKWKGGYYYYDFNSLIAEIPLSDDELDEEYEERDTECAELVSQYNEVCMLIRERKYESAFSLFSTLTYDYRCNVMVLDEIHTAAMCDSHFNINQYLVSIIPLIGPMLVNKDIRLVGMLLACGGFAADFAEGGADEYINEIDDVDRLRELGMIFCNSGKYQTAKKFFDKVLSKIDIDERSLFYLANICEEIGKEEEGKRYLNRYMAVTKCVSDAPSELMAARYGKKFGVPDDYFRLTEKEEKEMYRDIQLLRKSQDIDEKDKPLLMNYFQSAGDPVDQHWLLDDLLPPKTGKKRPNVCAVFIDLLGSPYVSEDFKGELLRALIASGYTGSVSYLGRDRAVFGEIAPYGHRGREWERIYNNILYQAFIEAELPIRPTLLRRETAKCAEKIGDYLHPEWEMSTKFLTTVVLANYLRALPYNYSISSMLSNYAITPAVMEKGFMTFRIDSLFV